MTTNPDTMPDGRAAARAAPRSRGRAGHKWRRLQARVFRTEAVCGLCHEPVDQTLSWPHPMSRSVDHIISIKVAPHLALERTNVQLAHLKCNAAKGSADELPRARTPTSRQW